jgi:transglutaminase-like putative cysteine protease
LALAVTEPAAARGEKPVLHEPIPPDPREDLALHASLDGDLPAAIQTPSGIVGAPDPRQMPSPSEASYGPGGEHDTFTPDRDTKRPQIETYDEPFTPSTAPFKRMEAFDAVRSDYQLYVHDPSLVPVPTAASLGPGDDAFYADVVVDLTTDRQVRIPSVGPGARILRARLGVGSSEVAFQVLRDGADNWFLQPAPHGGHMRETLRARLVMELAIAHDAFGGQLGDPSWSDLPPVPSLPENVAREASAVRAAIGVSRVLRPREAITKLVQYFRGFTDSEDSPHGLGSVYLDLALSRKGVCRHRAFAFLVTSQSLGIPTRMVLNEAHAWVEVHDGTLWRRIDLGGAGHMTSPASGTLAERAVHSAPPDPYRWPQGAERGDDMVADARARAGPAASGQSGTPSMAASAPATGVPPPSEAPATSSATENDERPASSVSLAVTDSEAHRGHPLHVRGEVRADGEPCAHVAVEVSLRDVKTHAMLLLGTLATDEKGGFVGGIVIPLSAPLGDYDVVARTVGDAACGPGGG